MPIFKTNHDIFKTNGEELWSEEQKNYSFLTVPESHPWDSSKEPTVEKIEVWEVIVESGGLGVYAAWSPYCQFYMLKQGYEFDTFFGPSEEKRLEHTLNSLNVSYPKV